MNQLRTISLVFLLLLSSSFAAAVEVEDLYQIQVPVADQNNKSRWKAMLTGFKEVVVRRSGSRQVLSSQEVQQAYAKVSAYVQRFEYAENPALAEYLAQKKLATVQPVKDEPEQPLPFNMLLDFEPRLIDQLIQDAGMPIWGSNRPITLLWLAVEDGLDRQLLKESDSLGEHIKAMKEQAQRRGVPIFYPLMDLEDQLSVSLSDVWGRFTGPVVEASARYAADSIVSGKIYRQGDFWFSKLTYLNDGNESSIEFSEANVEQLYTRLTNELAELLCQKYCTLVEQTQTNQVTLQVSNVTSFASYKRLQNYLESLSSIRKVMSDKIAANSVQLQISLLGDISSLQEDIRLGQKLVEEEEPINNPFKAINDFSENNTLVDPNETPIVDLTYSAENGQSGNDRSENAVEPDPLAENSSDLNIEAGPETESGSETDTEIEDLTESNLTLTDSNGSLDLLIVYYRWQK
ncbi:MAG: DUF2066 domain-containing protein [Kangiellaceae bacterium]|nr:DUF2066 domain-containing protein [Kangiellaceae bacterium]MCW8998126.1 DUF2066 domain-containing protein [Kangiellaceae bacterium]